ncbi:MAG: uroporphyrinogen decarboxylase family protein [Candidatus Latescibacterota bacterium]
MTGYELVKKAIEFDRPERLPFFQHVYPLAPNDVCDSWELDRQKAGWFFDTPLPDDWGCLWGTTEVKNMGQVVKGPLEEWSALDSYLPPNPCDPFYFERAEKEIANAGDRYVCLTSHFNLLERLHMLHGFEQTMMDFYFEPEKIERVLDMILDHKMQQVDEIHRRFGNRVHGVFLTDDWGTQQGPFVSPEIFDNFFFNRYKTLVTRYHEHGYHFILHSCGRINDLVERFIAAGVDVMNMQQPRAYGIEELGRRFRGRIAFLSTVDIQATLPTGRADLVRCEAHELVEHWSTPEGGFIVFNYGDGEGINVGSDMTSVMFDAFMEKMWMSESER